MFHFLGSVIFQPTFPYVHHRFANSTPEKTRPIQTTVSGGRIVNLHITINSVTMVTAMVLTSTETSHTCGKR